MSINVYHRATACTVKECAQGLAHNLLNRQMQTKFDVWASRLQQRTYIEQQCVQIGDLLSIKLSHPLGCEVHAVWCNQGKTKSAYCIQATH